MNYLVRGGTSDKLLFIFFHKFYFLLFSLIYLIQLCSFSLEKDICVVSDTQFIFICTIGMDQKDGREMSDFDQREIVNATMGNGFAIM